MSLDELREVFHDALDEYADTNFHMTPTQHPIDLHHRLQLICNEKWDDLNDFKVSLLRKVTRMYNETVFICKPNQVHQFQCRIPDGSSLPEFDQIFTREYGKIEDSVEDMIEKVVILTHLYSRDFLMYLDTSQQEL